MTLKVHIATVGSSKEPIMKVIRCISGINVLYLLHTACGQSQESAEQISDWVTGMIPDVRLRTVPLLDFMGIVQVIYNIRDEMGPVEAEYSVNITGGTNLMAAAACYGSFYIRAQIYYSVKGTDGQPFDSQVIRVEAPKAVDVSRYKDLTKDILSFIHRQTESGERVTKTMIATEFKITKQKVGYHTGILEKDGLLVQSRFLEGDKVDGRRSELSLTSQGVMVARNLR